MSDVPLLRLRLTREAFSTERSLGKSPAQRAGNQRDGQNLCSFRSKNASVRAHRPACATVKTSFGLPP
jgi:hypothetical protein